MKSPKFMLRSSRITSTKTHSTISYADTVQSNGISLSLMSQRRINPNQQAQSRQLSLGYSQRQLKEQLSEKDTQLKQRLSRLNSNLKCLQKSYKQNLKLGFQQKIKSFRLQAVMQRKMLQQTIQQTLKLNDLHEANQKHKLALKQKQLSQLNSYKMQQYRQNQLNNLKHQAQIVKNQNQHKRSTRLNEIQNKNRSMHDRIVNQEKFKDRKKNYLEYWKQEKIKRQEYQIKKEFLEKIVNNTKRIKGLKEELEQIEQKCEKIMQIDNKYSNYNDKSALFVTI